MNGPPTARQSADVDSENATVQIASIFRDMAEGFNARDVAQADRHFTADAVIVTPAGRRVRGLDAFLRYHAGRLTGPARNWHTRYEVLETTFVAPRVAIVHTEQNTTTGGGHFRNHGTFVVVERDDRWWIAAAHNTNVEEDG